ncbi:sterol desaturase family protein [Cytophagales bacterium LB-30]|uniref:Sterol desaturase family protein n=1 Tax=Shiella aurantiaca TaxID=3058365 RepID=A0ABT8F5I0_9BACT|nr:sterol desaturase family protein [Shiella aurantiaca]MDN4165524.1 sterol desaturase family protein [Shiella aurantiaca]
MTLAFHIFLVIATFFFMEFVAWFTHKYIMHGFLWIWHRSHHVHHNHALERNDLFALVFSIPAVALIVAGSLLKEQGWEFLMYIGFGVTAYGIFYFIFHDVIVHRRIKIKFVARSRYMKRIMRAHYVHHTVHTKEGAEAFGFLYAPKKYEKEEK